MLLALCSSFSAYALKKKILFIGNSYTYVNDLPYTLQQIAIGLGDSIEYDSNALGSATLQTHCSNAATLSKLQQPGWDYVVIQAQSQEPSFDPVQVATDTYPYAQILDSLVHVTNPCAETLFFMTWGRKNGDASNCAVYPPVCTYAGMQQRLRESYLEMSQLNQATCVPVGVAWKNVRNAFPGIELYQTDESHPSIHGTYLAACTFYSSIFHKESNGSPYQPVGILTWELLSMQNMASRTVLDSVETWQQYGQLPHSLFSVTSTGMQASFNNQSLRANSYSWNFGDGSALNTQLSPTHTYSAAGMYIATLTATNSCGWQDVFSDTVWINTAPNAVNETRAEPLISPYIQNGYLSWLGVNEPLSIEIVDATGRMVIKRSTGANTPLAIMHWTPGLYFYSVQTKSGRCFKGRMIVD